MQYAILCYDDQEAVMTWTEAGSLSCGSAHPYNHHEFHYLDVATG